MSQVLSMPKVGDILRIAREMADISQEALAHTSKKSKTTIQNAELGIGKPTGATLWAVAKALGYESYEDMADRVTHAKQKTQNHQSDIPVYDKIPAGRGDHNDGGFDVGVAETYIARRATGVEDPMAYAVKIDGESMMPTLSHGDMIVCSPSEVREHGFEEGRIYAIRFTPDLDSECTVKRVHILSKEEVELIPDNKRYERRIVLCEHIAHAARVVKSLIDL